MNEEQLKKIRAALEKEGIKLSDQELAQSIRENFQAPPLSENRKIVFQKNIQLRLTVRPRHKTMLLAAASLASAAALIWAVYFSPQLTSTKQPPSISEPQPIAVATTSRDAGLENSSADSLDNNLSEMISGALGDENSTVLDEEALPTDYVVLAQLLTES